MPNGYQLTPATRPGRMVVVLLLILALSACASPETISDAELAASDDTTADSAGTSADKSDDPVPRDPVPPDPVTELSAELLYDVLLAAIAGQRQQPEIALEALTRAVYLSRDKRLNINAIQLALHLGDNQKAIEMSRLMLADDPDNFRVLLALASAQVKSGQVEEAATTLIDLARKQHHGDEQVLQDIATLISRQDAADIAILERLLLASATRDEPSLLLTSALLASHQDQDAEFRSRLEQLLTVDPGWEVAAMLKLTDLSTQDNNDEAVNQWANSYLGDHSESTRFRIQYARLLIQQENLDDALDQLNEVIRQQPDSTDALFTAAVVNMDKEEYEDAKEQFRRYISLSDNGDQARLFLARILIEEEDYDSASPILRQVQSRQLYLDAQIALSEVIAKQSNVDAGLSYLRNIDVRAENDRVRLILEQDSLLRTFDMEKRSLELLSEALEERPEQPDLLYSRGLLAAQLNNLELIERDMRRLIELQPDNAHAYNALGYTLADQTDRYDEALELISKALEFLPDDPFILDSMGWVNFRIGNNAKALDYLRRAIEIKQDPEIAAHLGEVLWVIGEHSEAIKIWQQGKEWGADNKTLNDTMKRLLGDVDDQRAYWMKPVTSPLLALDSSTVRITAVFLLT